MTPKEKAKSILEKMAIKFQDGTSRADLQPNFKIAENKHFRKCAIILVDEMLTTIDSLSTGEKYVMLIYWQNVKSEIENM